MFLSYLMVISQRLINLIFDGIQIKRFQHWNVILLMAKPYKITWQSVFSVPITFTNKDLNWNGWKKTINWIFNICATLKKLYFKVRRSKEIKANQSLTKRRKITHAVCCSPVSKMFNFYFFFRERKINLKCGVYVVQCTIQCTIQCKVYRVQCTIQCKV